ncbi:DNA repair-scaffolding protein [Gadus macrocephalus]|uniref:DNA repair-scaffolding protein n=1 Tax=Gadus macrocephalus TaxID=80720 RepID=UPI0028CB8F92|nr:DNA repair-scaffolding protein [Gadus macrocephalus]
MSSLKRKKFSRDIRCVVFPDEVGHNSANTAAGLTAPSTGKSAARAWERCGESFIDLPKVKDGHSSGRTLSAVRKLDPASFSVHDSSGHHDDDPVDIAWTSSENEGSGDERPKQSLAKAVPPKRQERKRKTQRPAGRASHALPAGEAPSISSHRDDEDPLDIAWTSSSESERSDTDRDRSLARAMAPGPPERRRKTLRPTAAVECSAKPPTDEEDLPIIDSDSDLNGSPDQLKRDTAGHISECESPRHAVHGGLKAPISPGVSKCQSYQMKLNRFIQLRPIRLCALVQDGRGIFSVVQLQPLPWDRELQQYTQKWQGRACALRNVKVVQRVTRERYGRAFQLIDSVWPPTIPFQGRGTSAAPCFYYLLSGQEDSVEALEGSALSALYLPPKELPLRDVLRSAGGVRCHSFTATVVYASILVRPPLPTLGDAVDQAEVWLSLTDPSLQEEGEGQAEGGGPCRRTVPVCISTSCVLNSSVAAAIRSPAAAILSFRDVVMENGALLCTEQSVVETPHPDRAGRSELTGSEPPTPTRATLGCGLPRPVRLDPLGADTTAHSLCTLTGVIVGVEEDTACSWPACSACGSDRLQATGAGEAPAFRCRACDCEVQQPKLRLQLEVTLASAVSDGIVKVKLHQNTIQSILPPAALQASEFPGYEVEHVLGKALGPIPVVVRVISRTPTLCIGVEEISL